MSVLDAERTRPLEGGASFTLRNRAARVIWGAAWLMLCRFTPPMLHGWRRLILRAFGARVGRGARIHGSAVVWLPRNLTLGEQALIGPGVRLYNQGHITIGERSVVSQRAHICASSHDLADPHFQLVLRPIVIGSGCWVAAEAFVGPGARLEDGAVLGARAVLFGVAEPDKVYSGNPAVPIKVRSSR